MLIVNFVIILIVALAFFLGYRRGFFVVFASLVGFVLASVTASVFYRPLILPTYKLLQLVPSLAGIVAYALIFTIVEVVYFVAVRYLLRAVPKAYLHNQVNQIAGSLLNGLKMIFFITITLIILKGLPAEIPQKHLSEAYLAKKIVQFSKPIHNLVDRLLGGTIATGVSFFTVKPESNEKIDLDFHVTAVSENRAAEAQMLDLINGERRSRGLNALTANPQAAAVARAHARDMFAKGYFSHLNPDGQDPFARLKAHGVKYIAAGENLALAPTLPLAHTGLMNSPPHRANILSIDFGTVGIGVIDGGRYGLMIAQEFTD